jgi:hypothetical protein
MKSENKKNIISDIDSAIENLMAGDSKTGYSFILTATENILNLLNNKETENTLNNVIEDYLSVLMGAMENKDHVFIRDILLYGIKPLLKNM